MKYGKLSPFTCPECHGTLTQLRDGKIVRFRCHTGHAFSTGALLEGTTEQIEARLWDVVRVLDEIVLLLNRMGEGMIEAGDTKGAERCFDQAREAHERSEPIRKLAMQTEPLNTESVKNDELP